MDSPVSAFAIYSKNPKPQNKNKKKQKKKARKSKLTNGKVENLSQKDIIEASRKIKKQQKKVKDNKNIIKKKTHKKKKQEPKNIKDTKKVETATTRKISEIEDIPTLVAALPTPNFVNSFEDESDGASSYSSSDCCNFSPVVSDSAEEGLKIFKWMIAPYDPNEFLNRVFEKKPLHIARSKPKYYKDLISTPAIDSMLRTDNIQFTKNIDVTSYENGKRETHNPEGRAHPHLLWDFYLNGCSIRLLNPQTYMKKLHLLNATLQEFFNCFVGANAYLTPPDSQGFAPHYDDIEAFILQAEGKKHWKIYKPRTDSEVLPRVSSKNFEQSEIGEPIMDVVLEAGDMLYFPRGYIHQGVTIDGEHSLHVTVSMYQKHSWADLFEKLIPAALQIAINENVDLRRGLPFDIYDNFGLVNSDNQNPRRNEIEGIIKSLFDKIKSSLPIDNAVDEMAKQYQYDALPPVLNDLEQAVTVFGDSDVMSKNGKVINRVEIDLDTKIRLLRKNILRMVVEDQIKLYYHVENSLEYHGNELAFIEIGDDAAVAVEALIKSYPQYVSVESLNLPNDSDKLDLADALWSRGLIMTEYPLDSIED